MSACGIIFKLSLQLGSIVRTYSCNLYNKIYIQIGKQSCFVQMEIKIQKCVCIKFKFSQSIS